MSPRSLVRCATSTAHGLRVHLTATNLAFGGDILLSAQSTLTGSRRNR